MIEQQIRFWAAAIWALLGTVLATATIIDTNSDTRLAPIVGLSFRVCIRGGPIWSAA